MWQREAAGGVERDNPRGYSCHDGWSEWGHLSQSQQVSLGGSAGREMPGSVWRQRIGFYQR